MILSLNDVHKSRSRLREEVFSNGGVLRRRQLVLGRSGRGKRQRGGRRVIDGDVGNRLGYLSCLPQLLSGGAAEHSLIMAVGAGQVRTVWLATGCGRFLPDRVAADTAVSGTGEASLPGPSDTLVSE